MALALIAPPGAALTYSAYKALKAAGSVLGAVLAAAETAALGALAAKTALAVGAGVGGFMLGQAILANLAPETSMPDMGEYIEAGVPGGFAYLVFDFFIDGVKVRDAAESQYFSTPAKGIFMRVEGGGTVWFMLDGQNQRANIVEVSNTTSGTNFKLLDIRASASQALTPTKRLPSYVPSRPDTPVPLAPIPITIPGTQPFPITPLVVPNPGNEPGQDNEERPPGVIVQIPQTGQQITYSPDGVRISNYASPATRPFIVPQMPIPPGNKIAAPACCDDGGGDPPSPDLTEIICRIKTLQKEILDDGTNRINGQTPNAAAGFFEELDGDFYKVTVNVTQKPANLRIQSSTAPANDVWYVGWFAWVENGFPGERIPLHFQAQTFLPPPGITGFMYQVNAGCLATGQWQRRTKRPYIDLC